MSKESKQVEPKPKKLKSSEPDLRILVGTESKPYFYYSNIMANHSDYIDTMLASPMVESQTMEIRFPDIESEVWEKLVAFLEKPINVLEMTVKDAMDLAPLYDKYNFREGRELCSRVLAKYMKKEEEPQDLDLGLRVDVVLLADEFNLEQAYNAGVEDLRRKLGDVQTRIIFTEAQVKKMVPLIAKEKSLLRAVGKTKEEVLSPLFPEYLIQKYSSWRTGQILDNAIPFIQLSGSRCKADGLFHYDNFDEWTSDRSGQWAGQELKFFIKNPGSGWEIIGETLPDVDEDGEEYYENVVSKTLWRAPNSGNFIIPPRNGWKAVDALSRGDPKLQYIYADN